MFSCFRSPISQNKLNYNSIENFISKNVESGNNFFKFGKITIDYKTNAKFFIFNIQTIRMNISNSILFELTNKFGSPENQWNSEISNDKNVYSNDCFHILVPKKIFYDYQEVTISKMKIFLNLHFIAWDPVAKKYQRWENYLESFEINFRELLNIPPEISALNIPFILNIPSSITISNLGKIIDHQQESIVFNWDISINNYLLQNIANVTIPENMSTFILNGYLKTNDKINFDIDDGKLKFNTVNVKKSSYSVVINTKTYFNPETKKTSLYPTTEIYDSRTGLIIPYYNYINLRLGLVFLIGTFINISLYAYYIKVSFSIFEHDGLSDIFN